MSKNKTIAQFEDMYDQKLNENSSSNSGTENPTSCDIFLKSICEEGYLLNHPDPLFVRHVFKFMLSQYFSMGDEKIEGELNSMWKIFAQLEENGLPTTSDNNQNQQLYLEIAKRAIMVSGSRLPSQRERTELILSLLQSFDHTYYLFQSLYDRDMSYAKGLGYQYPAYSELIKRIAPYCKGKSEHLLYFILRIQLYLHQCNHNGNYGDNKNISQVRGKIEENSYRAIEVLRRNHIDPYNDEDCRDFVQEVFGGLGSNISLESKNPTQEEVQRVIGQHPEFLKRPSKRNF